jgi:hypothetical protein
MIIILADNGAQVVQVPEVLIAIHGIISDHDSDAYGGGKAATVGADTRRLRYGSKNLS